MAEEKSDLFTAGKIAKELGVADGKVKKAIESLGIKPELKKGACNYYSKEALDKIKNVLNQ
jgi:hypothetical protein